MKVLLESTTKVATLNTPDGSMPARIWEGTTADGVRVYAYIPQIHAVHLNDAHRLDEWNAMDNREPSPIVLAIVEGGGD
jgi:hypothetical protein